jgi:hypothetical protein
MKLGAGQIIGVVEGRQCIGRRFGERLMLPDGGLYLIDATAEPVLVAGESGCRAAGVLEVCLDSWWSVSRSSDRSCR